MAAEGKIDRRPRRRRPSRWSVIGGLVALAALGVVLWRIDYGRLMAVVAEADPRFLALPMLAIAVEQMVRAWKWRQLLLAVRPVATRRLFGAIMAGYLAGFLLPLGISPIVRSWLVARLEALKLAVVLATAAIDRLVDGVVFCALIALALPFVVLPDGGTDLRAGLALAGAGSFTLFVLLLIGLAAFKRRAGRGAGLPARLLAWLPARHRDRADGLVRAFADGVVWPRQRWRGGAVVAAAATMKAIATTHLLWAGLAFGVLLRPIDYVFLVAFLGFLVILSRVGRVPGGFLIGGVFALELLGVEGEQALAMVMLVQLSTVALVTVAGGAAMWRGGIALDEVRRAGG